jgi:hypothetical protein
MTEGILESNLLCALMVKHDLSDDLDFGGKRDRVISITPAGLGFRRDVWLRFGVHIKFTVCL